MQPNTLTRQDRQELEEHFAYRLKTRYNIEGNPKGLQKAFRNQARYQNEVAALDNFKSVFICNFRGQRVKFIYNREIGICKTALRMNR